MPDKELKLKKLKSIPPVLSQMILRLFGIYASTYIGNDVYFLVKSIYVMLSDLGEDYVKEEWEKKGHNWEITKKNLIKLDKKAIEVKAYYDSIEDKKMEKKDKEVKIKKYYIKTASKIPILLPEAYELFVFLIKETPIQKQTIPSDAFKIIEHVKYRTIELGKKDRTHQVGEFPTT